MTKSLLNIASLLPGQPLTSPVAHARPHAPEVGRPTHVVGRVHRIATPEEDAAGKIDKRVAAIAAAPPPTPTKEPIMAKPTGIVTALAEYLDTHKSVAREQALKDLNLTKVQLSNALTRLRANGTKIHTAEHGKTIGIGSKPPKAPAASAPTPKKPRGRKATAARPRKPRKLRAKAATAPAVVRDAPRFIPCGPGAPLHNAIPTAILKADGGCIVVADHSVLVNIDKPALDAISTLLAEVAP